MTIFEGSVKDQSMFDGGSLKVNFKAVLRIYLILMRIQIQILDPQRKTLKLNKPVRDEEIFLNLWFPTV